MKKFIKYFLITLLLFLIIYYLYSVISIKSSYKDINSLKDSDSKFIKIENFNLHYKEYGDGDKTILLIHGFAANTFSFRDVFEPLSKYGKVIAIDIPGFGLTERPNRDSLSFNPYSRDGEVEVIKLFLDKLKINKVIILGHSMGGGIATYFTIKYTQYVEKLIIEDGALFDMGGPPNFVSSLLKSPIGKLIWPMIVKPLITQISKLKDIAYYNKEIVTEEVLNGYKKVLYAKNWDYGLYEIIVSQDNLKISERLNEIAIPTLIIWGEFDKVIPLENGYKLNKEIKNSELIIIKECGHVPHEEKTTEFLTSTIDFIKK